MPDLVDIDPWLIVAAFIAVAVALYLLFKP